MSASRSATSSGAIASRMSDARSTSRRSRIEGGEDGVAIVRAELVDDIRDVGRVQLGELGVGDPQLDRADVGLDRIDRLPGNQLLRPVQPEAPGNPPTKTLEPDPPRQPPA